MAALALVLALSLASTQGPSWAQDAPPRAVSLRLDVSSTLRFHDNLGLDTPSMGSTLHSDTRLAFGLLSETRTQRLALNVAGNLQAERTPGGGRDLALVSPSLGLSYARELKRGAISATATADISVSDLSQVQRVLSTDLGSQHLLGEGSAVRFGLNYTDVRDAGSTGVVPRQQGTFTAAFSRELAPDWELSVGAERRYLKETNRQAWDNALFVTVDRSFVFLP